MEYKNKAHGLDEQYLENLCKNMTTASTEFKMAELENTGNTVHEMKSLLVLERKRQTAQIQLAQKEQKRNVKKDRVGKRK